MRGAANSVQHEASVSKVSEEQIFYMRQRGLTEGQAMSLSVNGFINDLARQFPMEYSVELKRLIDLEMEGSRRLSDHRLRSADPASSRRPASHVRARSSHRSTASAPPRPRPLPRTSPRRGARPGGSTASAPPTQRFAGRFPCRGAPTRRWRFSTLSADSTLDGLALPPGRRGRRSPAAVRVSAAASLAFANNRLVARSARLPPASRPEGWSSRTLAEALPSTRDLLKAHFMAQPQRLGSEKFAALHTAFVADGAFIHMPRGVELADPILVIHAAAGAGAAVFPHTLVIAEENSRVTVVDHFVSDRRRPGQFACGAQRSLRRPRLAADLCRGPGLVAGTPSRSSSTPRSCAATPGSSRSTSTWAAARPGTSR